MIEKATLGRSVCSGVVVLLDARMGRSCGDWRAATVHMQCR